ncbi:hypothetical protein [Denitratisoma oestradiolicum]|uniref:Lipoprotein n=1 Tax=Denitratisoma oestradiolicum TaxID=311182 RepID=A0A6S6XRS0_9PROT|nr:hypothetical protein [Denitratisoma oestradiolicum]CAB1367380.1 conserved exported protein of unknown function [Denitratisoma oestradiolicum]
MKKCLVLIGFSLVACTGMAQVSQRTKIQGNTEINVSTQNTVAVATGENTVAKNRVGVIQGSKKGNTKISVSASNVTTVVGGRDKKACTNIGGIVSDDCK